MEIQFPTVTRFTGKIPAGKRGWDKCILCDRPVNPGTAPTVHLSTHGGFLVDESDDHPHSQGWFPVGPECAKKIERAIADAQA